MSALSQIKYGYVYFLCYLFVLGYQEFVANGAEVRECYLA